MSEIIEIESTAAVIPCLFCGKRKVARIITIYACRERGYEDVSFLSCPDCLQKIGKELNTYNF